MARLGMVLQSHSRLEASHSAPSDAAIGGFRTMNCGLDVGGRGVTKDGSYINAGAQSEEQILARHAW